VQVKLRLNRLSKTKKNKDNLYFVKETNLELLIDTLQEKKQQNKLIIVDSIQSLWSDTLSGSAGSVGQVRYCANQLLGLAKATQTPLFLVGHVTKEGRIAGPKVLEHLVDTVLYLEGEKDHDFRVLRAVKNRFGPTDEVGIFKMTDKGMKEIKNPSEMLLGEEKHVPGSAITVTMQGVRPMLVEIQGLVVPSTLATPRRVASGIDYSRLQVIVAVLQKRAGIPLYDNDVFVNVAGGFKLTEPAADLAIAMALASSYKDKPLPQKTAVIGELGLLGEIRKVSFMKKREKEAKNLGYEQVIGAKDKNLRKAIKLL
jgi:DNA repair protein RadA/Sms